MLAAFKVPKQNFVALLILLIVGLRVGPRPSSQASSTREPLLGTSNEGVRTAESPRHIQEQQLVEMEGVQESPQTFFQNMILVTSPQQSPWKLQMWKRLLETVRVCGIPCQINSVEQLRHYVSSSNPFFDEVSVPFQCSNLLSSQYLDAADRRVRFPLPEELYRFYSMNSSVKVNMFYRYRNIYAGRQAMQSVWTHELVETLMEKARNKTLEGTYSVEESRHLYELLEKFGQLPGARALVIGSEKPWVESICLALGAADVTTIEYGKIESRHSLISTMTPDDLRRGFSNKTVTLEQFDVVVIYSSVEHSGLGRYGDALSPWGDIMTVARAWCLTKLGGRMVMSVPIGTDRVEFNGHRVYGPVRYALLMANWRMVSQAQLEDSSFASDWNNASLASSAYARQPPIVFEKVPLK